MRRDPDRRFELVLRAGAAAGLALPLVVIGFVAWEALPALRSAGAVGLFGWQWYPSSGRFGLGALVVASLCVTAGALALASPVALAAALAAEASSPAWIGRLLRRSGVLLASVPSVVVGLVGLEVVVPLLARVRPPGASLLAGVLTLTAMIAPTAFLFADAALRQTPDAQRRAALALGLGRFATARCVLLPQARRAVAAGLLLATARALGETMVVAMVCGNVVRLPKGPFDPVRPLTANIALEMAYAEGGHRAALMAGGLVLVAGAVVLVLAAAALRGAERRRGSA